MAESHLRCGASYDDLLAQVADDSPARDPVHQRGCPHCRAALAELQTLWQPLNALAAEETHAPAELLATVMARVRQLPRHTWHAVIPGDRGETRVAARVVAAVARLAAEEVPAVTLAFGGGRTGASRSSAQIAGPAGESATDVGVAGTHVVVDVQVAVEMGTDIPAVGEQLRAHVGGRIAAYTGLTPAEVNVTIVDVQSARPPRRRG